IADRIMPMRNFYFFALSMFLLSSPLIAREPVTYIGIENGLSNNFVTKIFQDSKGFMWFGTFDGLNRYDGYQFKVYKNQPGSYESLIDNRITDLKEDEHGQLWVATKKGISIMNSTGSGFFPIQYMSEKNDLKTAEFVINGLAFDSGEKILIASDRGGVFVVPDIQKGQNRAFQVPYVNGQTQLVDYN